MAVVKGMLLVKADTRADTHTIKMMATVNWCCIGTLWVGGGGGGGGGGQNTVYFHKIIKYKLNVI